MTPKMALLPGMRTKQSDAFTYVGVDLCGPFYVKDDEKNELEAAKARKKKPEKEKIYKVYVVLFTCLSTRAIHVEVALRMDTRSFMECLRRTIARRGTPHVFLSDNALNFKRASKELKELWSQVDLDKITEQMIAKRVEWRFIPERAPWFGGFYERAIKAFKEPLKAALQKRYLPLENFRTLVAEAEGFVNGRPLTTNSASFDDPDRVTPAKLITGRDLQYLPAANKDLEEVKTKKDTLAKLRHIRTIRQHMWRRYSSQYLASLVEFQKWTDDTPDLREGEIVIVKDEFIGRPYWPLARVISTTKNWMDGRVRSATVRTGDNRKLTRPVQHFCRLEL